MYGFFFLVCSLDIAVKDVVYTNTAPITKSATPKFTVNSDVLTAIVTKVYVCLLLRVTTQPTTPVAWATHVCTTSTWAITPVSMTWTWEVLYVSTVKEETLKNR